MTLLAVIDAVDMSNGDLVQVIGSGGFSVLVYIELRHMRRSMDDVMQKLLNFATSDKL